MDGNAEADFDRLYDGAQESVVRACEQIDSDVLSFAIEHDLMIDEVWERIRDEATTRSDRTLAQLADEHPTSGAEGSWKLAATIAAGRWALRKWAARRS